MVRIVICSALVALLSLFESPAVWAGGAPQTYTVDTLDDVVDASDGVLSLREAIQETIASAPNSTINFSVTGTITLASPLPNISLFVNIEGPGRDQLTISGGGIWRIFTVTNDALLTISDLTIADAFTKGGDGGGGEQRGGSGGGAAGMGAALFVYDGGADVRNVDFVNNDVVGGDGANSGGATGGSGGGGGGLGGDGETARVSNPNGGFGGLGDPLPGPANNGGADGGPGAGGAGGIASSTVSQPGGTGGFGGGGGGGGKFNAAGVQAPRGGDGGFGGGSGGGGGSGQSNSSGNDPGTPGMFGGIGGASREDGNVAGSGGGGAGLGGSIFVRTGNLLLLDNCSFTNCDATGGTGGGGQGNAQPGQGKGGAIFIMDGANARGDNLSFSGNSAADDEGSSGDNDDIFGELRPLSTQPIVVDTLEDQNDGPALNGVSLREAIQAANNDDGSSITFSVTGTINLQSSLPPITASMSIFGPGEDQLTISGDDGSGQRSRIFSIIEGDELTLTDVTLADGLAQGGNGGDGPQRAGGGGGAAGMGGAIFLVGSNANLINVTFQNNDAIGGDGGSNGPAFIAGGGGGGGIGGDGESRLIDNIEGGQGGIGTPFDELGAMAGENGESGAGGGGGFRVAIESSPGGNGGFGGGGGGGGRYTMNDAQGPRGGNGGFGGGSGGGGCPNSIGAFTAGQPGTPGMFGGSGTSSSDDVNFAGQGGGGAGLGGAIFADEASIITLDNCTFTGCSATGGVGGVRLASPEFNGEPGLGKGGAIFFEDSTDARARNLTFSGNLASDDEGIVGDTDDVFGQFEYLVDGPIIVDTLEDQNDGPLLNGLSLREAVSIANENSGSTIQFGVTGTINLALGKLENIREDMNIEGPGADQLTLSADDGLGTRTRLLTIIEPANLTLSGMTLADGFAKGGNGGNRPQRAGAGGGAAGLGGAIFLASGTAHISNVAFVNNDTEGGRGGGPGSGTGGSGGGGGGMGGDGETALAPNNNGGDGGNGSPLFGDGGTNGGNGGEGAGGGGGPSSSTQSNPGGNGGFGGGGGGAANRISPTEVATGGTGGNGGFGGGSGGGGGVNRFGSTGGVAGTPGEFGGRGGDAADDGNVGGSGGGGAGLGGAIFVGESATLDLQNCSFSGSSAVGGEGGIASFGTGETEPGQGKGGAIFIMDGATATAENITFDMSNTASDGDGQFGFVDTFPNDTNDVWGFINVRDCNGNDIPDGADIVNGTSRDCNMNGIPDECEDPPAIAYQLDDNTRIGRLGNIPDSLFMNQFTVAEGGEFLTAVDTAYFDEGVSVGDPITVVVYDDPNNDGDPTDAVLVARVDTTLQIIGEGTVQRVQLPQPVYIGAAGDSFFIGNYFSHPGGGTPHSTSPFYVPNRAFFAGANTQGLGDLNDLSDASAWTFATVREITLIDSNFTRSSMVRGVVGSGPQGCDFDFGDAPAPYPTLLADNGARHAIHAEPTLYMGFLPPDGESDGFPSLMAEGDDSENPAGDDEDGVIFGNNLNQGATIGLFVQSSADGFVDAWVDWNQDGSWSEDERVLDSVPISAGPFTEYPLPVPRDAPLGFSFARIRLSSTGGLLPTGFAPDGEVEDQAVLITRIDCNGNDISDAIDVADGTSADCNNNGRPDECEASLGYIIADGPGQGAAGNIGDSLMMNQFTVRPGLETLRAFGVEFGVSTGLSSNLAGGEPVTLIVYDDPNNDGDPADATVISTIETTITEFDNGEFQRIIAPAPIPLGAPGDSYFIAVYFSTDSNEFAITIDNDAPGGFQPGRSFFAKSTTPGSGDISDLTSATAWDSETIRPIDGSAQFGDVNPVIAGFAYVANCAYDFGDAPAPYPTLFANNGAQHGLYMIDTGVRLGAVVDGEPNGAPSTAADGDDLAGGVIANDEDGVAIDSVAFAGSLLIFDVEAPLGGRLDAWIDFNGDGDWEDAGEQVFTNTVLAAGTNQLGINIPPTADLGVTYARFRISSNGGLTPSFPADDGEVEDYRIDLQNPTQLLRLR